MMRAPAPRVAYAIAFFGLSFALLIVTKPLALFDASGKPIPFGVRAAPEAQADVTDAAHTTLIPLGVVVVVIAIASLYVFAMIDLLSNR
jgi:hypothetical protein